MNHRTRQLTIFVVIASVIALVDLITKEIAASLLAGGPLTVDAVGHTLRLVLVHNELSAFGVSLGPFTREINVVATFAAIVLAVPACARLHDLDRFAPLALGLIAGAAFGNLFSMLTSAGGVVDFLALSRGGRELVFNVADMAAYAGAVLLLRTVVIVAHHIRLERAAPSRAAALATRRPVLERVVPIPRAPLIADQSAPATAPAPAWHRDQSFPRDREARDLRSEA